MLCCKVIYSTEQYTVILYITSAKGHTIRVPLKVRILNGSGERARPIGTRDCAVLYGNSSSASSLLQVSEGVETMIWT